jgi:hypothetical protein
MAVAPQTTGIHVLKRAGLFTAVTLTALTLTAACSTGDTTTTTSANTPSDSPATAATSAPASTASTTKKPATTPVGDPGDNGTGNSDPGDSGPGDPGDNGAGDPGDSGPGDPGDGDMLAGLGTDADWKKYLKACPDSRQKILIQKVTTGDVNGDGTYDALVGHACSPITSYWPSEVDVFDGASSTSAPKRLGTLLADVGASDSPYLDSLKVKNGTVVIGAYGAEAGGDRTCLSTYFTYQFKFKSGKFTRTARTIGDANHCANVTN